MNPEMLRESIERIGYALMLAAAIMGSIPVLHTIISWWKRRKCPPQPRPKAPRDCWRRSGKRQALRMEDGE